jgi:hypothetical protein
MSGRLPQGPDEIALGPAALDNAHRKPGTMVKVGGPTGGAPVAMRVVGTVLLPSDDAAPGRHAMVTPAGFTAIGGSGGSAELYLRFRRGIDVEATIADLLPDREADIQTVPTNVANLRPARSTPRFLALFLGALAVFAAAHGIITAARRRRRDLAVLRAMGFRGAQIVGTISAHATIWGVTTAVLGLPLGVALGRLVWSQFAAGLRVLPIAVTPSVVGLACLGAAPVLVNMAAVFPALAARRMRVADVLRTE